MQWYETLFENYARQYDDECYTKGTLQECDFLEKEFSGIKSLSILDIGCGTGRHSVEFAQRGYSVTGIDLSQAQLARAKMKAKDAGVSVDFLQCDARNIPFNNQFDCAIMLCEGAFCLLETDEMNFAVLKNAAAALKSGGKFIFTALSGLYRVARVYNPSLDVIVPVSGDFDVETMREQGTMEFTDDSGIQKNIHHDERCFMPSEIRFMLTQAGFSDIGIYGCMPGRFNKQKLNENDFELMAIAEKL